MQKKWIIVIIVAVFFFVLAYGLLLVWLVGSSMTRLAPGKGIALIRLEGVIAASTTGGGLIPRATISPEEIIDQLRQANRDSEIKAVLLRVDSPGGTAAASQEIYAEIRRSKKPVIVSIGDIGASGAYYVASAADQIMASPASAVGSIGVIIEIPNYQELLKKLGIDYVVITQGKFKDIGNPNRPLTEEEKEILTSQARVVYEQFIMDVARGRRLSREEIRNLATGLTFPGSEAVRLGLIDQLGNFQDAVDLAAKFGKIKGEPRIIEYKAPSFLDLFRTTFLGGSSAFQESLFLKYLQSLPLQHQVPR